MTPARLAANISGTPSKGRIYALHGVTDNAASLSDISARWSNDYEVVLIDALGHGCSPCFTPTQLEDPFEALVSAAASLICTIEEASPAPFVTLLGHSMGGATAAEVVSRGLAPVDALVLEDPALLTPSQREHFRASAEDRVARCNEGTQWMGREIDILLKDYPQWSPSEAGGWAQGKAQVDRNFLARGVVSGSRSREEILSPISVPTLLMTGDGDDVLIGQSGFEEINALGNPAVETLLIPHARHCVRRSAPAPFYDAVDAFFSRVTPSK